jgi:hypothetical protein
MICVPCVTSLYYREPFYDMLQYIMVHNVSNKLQVNNSEW